MIDDGFFPRLTGVLEVGLFCGMAQEAYFGNSVNHPNHPFPLPSSLASIPKKKTSSSQTIELQK
jgi:hypothetical protein